MFKRCKNLILSAAITIPEKPEDVRPSAVNVWLSGDNRTAKG
jgi:hypothetical protein